MNAKYMSMYMCTQIRMLCTYEACMYACKYIRMNTCMYVCIY